MGGGVPWIEIIECQAEATAIMLGTAVLHHYCENLPSHQLDKVLVQSNTSFGIKDGTMAVSDEIWRHHLKYDNISNTTSLLKISNYRDSIYLIFGITQDSFPVITFGGGFHNSFDLIVSRLHQYCNDYRRRMNSAMAKLYLRLF